MERVRVMWPRLPEADAVAGYLRSMDAARTYSNFGPLVTELEARYAKRFNVPASRVVTCSSATLGLQGALEMLPAGMTVHCPSWTFPATPIAIANAGHRIAFHDVSEGDWQIDVEAAPTERDALVPVLPFGAQFELARWRQWKYVVLDAAASGGATDLDLSGLPATWAVVVSLHATKVLGAGEGGVVILGTDAAAERFRSFTNLGFVVTRSSDVPGTNAKLSEPGAAYGLAALDQWEQEEREWRAARELVQAAEARLGLGSPCSSYPGVNPYWILRFPTPEIRHAVEVALAAQSIESRRWWEKRCDQMSAFDTADVVSPTGGFPVSDAVVSTVLGLPFHRDLTLAEVDRVVSVIESVQGAVA